MPVRSYDKRKTSPKIVGKSPSFLESIERLKLAAKNPQLNVLFLGEPGCGKQFLAERLHEMSKLPGCLQQIYPDEFFSDYKYDFFKNSFAIGTPEFFRKEYIERKAGSSILVADIDQTPLHFQNIVADVLKNLDRRFPVVGRTPRAGVRFIFTASPKATECREISNSRDEMIFNLVYRIVVPPLRDRERDSVLIARRLLKAHPLHGYFQLRLGADAETFIEKYPWPGNVREIKNMFGYLPVKGRGETISASDLCEALDNNLAKSVFNKIQKSTRNKPVR